MLEDGDLKKICDKLVNEKGLKTIKIGNNNFTSVEGISELLKAKGK